MCSDQSLALEIHFNLEVEQSSYVTLSFPWMVLLEDVPIVLLCVETVTVDADTNILFLQVSKSVL